MRNLFFIGMVIVSGCWLAGCAWDKADSGSGSPASTRASDPYAPESNLLRIGDPLTIQLSGVPQMEQATFPLKVDDNGNISMPHIGNIKAAGITTAELKNNIETLYKTSRIYTNPTITINSYQERYVSVSGEVRSPTRLPYSKDMTVLGVIAAAGGFTDYADRADCQLIRDGVTIPFDAKAALKDPKKDKPLLPGDIVHIKRSIF